MKNFLRISKKILAYIIGVFFLIWGYWVTIVNRGLKIHVQERGKNETENSSQTTIETDFPEESSPTAV